MSVIRCKCGKVTNTAVSDYWHVWVRSKEYDKKITESTECYAAFENGVWVRGCAYDRADLWTKVYVDKLITGREKL